VERPHLLGAYMIYAVSEIWAKSRGLLPKMCYMDFVINLQTRCTVLKCWKHFFNGPYQGLNPDKMCDVDNPDSLRHQDIQLPRVAINFCT